MPITTAQDAAIMQKAAITLIVNGTLRHVDVDPRTSLLEALREHLHLTGTKKGCDHGQCGIQPARVRPRGGRGTLPRLCQKFFRRGRVDFRRPPDMLARLLWTIPDVPAARDRRPEHFAYASRFSRGLQRAGQGSGIACGL
jgi:hypothetical protein